MSPPLSTSLPFFQTFEGKKRKRSIVQCTYQQQTTGIVTQRHTAGAQVHTECGGASRRYQVLPTAWVPTPARLYSLPVSPTTLLDCNIFPPFLFFSLFFNIFSVSIPLLHSYCTRNIYLYTWWGTGSYCWIPQPVRKKVRPDVTILTLDCQLFDDRYYYTLI